MVNLIQPITVQQAYDRITHARRWESWNWWWRMVDDDDGDGFPSPEPKTDSRSALPMKNRAWQWLRLRVWLNFDMVSIIQPFSILMCQLFVSKRTSLDTNVCASSQTGRFFYHDIYVPCHETMPSFMLLGWLFDLLGFKTRDSQCFRTTTSL